MAPTLTGCDLTPAPQMLCEDHNTSFKKTVLKEVPNTLTSFEIYDEANSSPARQQMQEYIGKAIEVENKLTNLSEDDKKTVIEQCLTEALWQSWDKVDQSLYAKSALVKKDYSMINFDNLKSFLNDRNLSNETKDEIRLTALNNILFSHNDDKLIEQIKTLREFGYKDDEIKTSPSYKDIIVYKLTRMYESPSQGKDYQDISGFEAKLSKYFDKNPKLIPLTKEELFAGHDHTKGLIEEQGSSLTPEDSDHNARVALLRLINENEAN